MPDYKYVVASKNWGEYVVSDDPPTTLSIGPMEYPAQCLSKIMLFSNINFAEKAARRLGSKFEVIFITVFEKAIWDKWWSRPIKSEDVEFRRATGSGIALVSWQKKLKR